jgi:hypothetical protein
MKVSALKYTVLTWIANSTMVILFLLPFHALLTVWAGSHFGHYTAIRLWKEALVALSLLGVAYLYLTDHKIRYHTLSRRLVWLILAYMGLNLVWAALALNQRDVEPKAVAYGLLLNLRFLAFFLVTWAVAVRLTRVRTNWYWLVLLPAAGVVVFGLLQALILPDDFLRHLGYGPHTIPVIETINHNQHYIRIASTLRGANPLGAYLIIPICLLGVLLIRNGRNWRQAVFLAAALATLFFSFSRSAWAGAALSIVVLVYMSKLSRKSQKIALGTAAVLVVIAAGLTVAYRHSPHFQNLVFHTQTHSAVPTSSNDDHVMALKNGLKDLRRHPLGGGPGSAGPASVYDSGHPVRIAENYFLQIGQETGWLGMAMFIVINLGVGYLLWLRRADPLALSLFAALIGLTFINLLSHAWTDDTLSYVWWGLAGVAMAPDKKAKDEARSAKA